MKDIQSMTAERLLNSGIDSVKNIKDWAKGELGKLPPQANVRTKLSTLWKAFVARPDVAQEAALEKAYNNGVDVLDSFLANAMDTIKRGKSDALVGRKLGELLNASNLDASFPGITERINSILKSAGDINLNLTDVESDANFNQNWEKFAVEKNVPQGKVQGNAPVVKDVEEKNINPETQGPSNIEIENVAESNVQSPMERLKSLLTQEEQECLSRLLDFPLDSDKGQKFAELAVEYTNIIAKELAESKDKNQTAVDDIKKMLKQDDAGDDVSNQDVYRAFIKSICEDEGLRETLMSEFQDMTPAGGDVQLGQVDQPPVVNKEGEEEEISTKTQPKMAAVNGAETIQKFDQKGPVTKQMEAELAKKLEGETGLFSGRAFHVHH